MAARHSVDPDGWMVIFNELMTRIAGHFGRVEPRRTATAYVRALLADIDRKNCWNLAEHAGLTGPQTLQRLLRTARWDADAVRDDIRDFVVDRLGPDGVLIARAHLAGRPRPLPGHRHPGPDRLCHQARPGHRHDAGRAQGRRTRPLDDRR